MYVYIRFLIDRSKQIQQITKDVQWALHVFVVSYLQESESPVKYKWERNFFSNLVQVILAVCFGV